MPSVTYVESDGTSHQVEAPSGRTLMQIALDNGVPGILGECGGACSCATCHGYVEAPWAERLPPIAETEAVMLELVSEPRPTSRLCCQIRMHEGLDGMVVQLPAEQI